MSKRISNIRTAIYIVTAIAILAAVGAYLALPKGITSMSVYADGDAAGDTVSLYEGTGAQLSCEIKPESFADRTVSFRSADETVVSIDDSGSMTAMKPGEAVVTLQAAGFRKNLTVKVESAVVDITGVDETISMTEGYSYTLEPEVVMASEDLEAPALSYKSGDESIVTVDEDGNVTAAEPGETTITVSAGGVTKTIQATVKAKPVVVSTPKKTTKKKTNNNNNNNDGDNGGGWEG